MRVVSIRGQTFLKSVSTVLAKPPTQDVVTACFAVLRDYFGALRAEGDPDLTLEELQAEAERFVSLETSPDTYGVCECLAADSRLARDILAMRVLSGVGYGVLRPLLADSTAIGSLMRRKLAPALEPLLRQIDLLRRAITD